MFERTFQKPEQPTDLCAYAYEVSQENLCAKWANANDFQFAVEQNFQEA